MTPPGPVALANWHRVVETAIRRFSRTGWPTTFAPLTGGVCAVAGQGDHHRLPHCGAARPRPTVRYTARPWRRRPALGCDDSLTSFTVMMRLVQGLQVPRTALSTRS